MPNLDGLLSQAKLFTFMSTQPVAIYASKGEMADGTLFGGQGNTFSSRCAVQDKNALWWFEQDEVLLVTNHYEYTHKSSSGGEY